MSVKQRQEYAMQEIQMARNTIQRSWSGKERKKRRRIAETLQQHLLAAMFSQQTAITVQVT